MDTFVVFGGVCLLCLSEQRIVARTKVRLLPDTYKKKENAVHNQKGASSIVKLFLEI